MTSIHYRHVSNFNTSKIRARLSHMSIYRFNQIGRSVQLNKTWRNHLLRGRPLSKLGPFLTTLFSLSQSTNPCSTNLSNDSCLSCNRSLATSSSKEAELSWINAIASRSVIDTMYGPQRDDSRRFSRQLLYWVIGWHSKATVLYAHSFWWLFQ